MAWSQLEPTGPHLTYLFLSLFLIAYAIFSAFIRNRLHLSEPPLATLFGIACGPRGLDILKPHAWSYGDNVVQELTRVVLGVECFAIGVELPRMYMRKNIRSLSMLLGPVMAYGWLICAVFVALLFGTDIPTALTVAACLTPTDPVLASSILAHSQFSERVPKRLRLLLQAESGCNDGISFPFLYVGLSLLVRFTIGGFFKKWLLISILYQCILGVITGLVVGYIFNKIFHYARNTSLIGRESFLVSYLLLALFSVGLASTLGLDDFLVAFSAGIAFSRDGVSPIQESQLSQIIDLLLNSTMFIFFGTIIPWADFTLDPITIPRLFGLLVLVLLFRRIPAVLVLKPWIPSIKTWWEALFTGHFGPMGVGALFLAMEARAQLETDSSVPLPYPPHDLPEDQQRAIDIVWPIICFIVLGSTMVHGLSTLAISLGGHYARKEGERAPLLGGETERLAGMADENVTDDEY
ncbi:Na(+)/H(+) antiporter 2 [Pseudovirgaria hyperparasitica]|uniref:Na(+)/H(+) antiporter 2 n=1 Tax=Pseudovirgaria hyperparasitica TaxID=470096 RepID=A0A6A6WB83_9PEZI|nr:Na(+)/H(+) antiporter 2 [Pseudovirgaria hyperparasitica]KAF2759304.1 Na(+)/H(+) antiporter 2 [Pseudovirgaria hyperparasitica]